MTQVTNVIQTVKPASISMYGKGLKHSESSNIVREGYKKFSIETQVIDVTGLIVSPDTPNDVKLKATQLVDYLIVDAIKSMASSLERDLSISNWEANKPQLFNPLDQDETGEFFKELIEGITLDDLYREVVENSLESRGRGGFNQKVWNAFIVEKFLPARNAYRVLVLNQAPFSQDQIKANTVTLKLGQKLKKPQKEAVINSILEIVEGVNSPSFSSGIIEGGLIHKKLESLKALGDSEKVKSFEEYVGTLKDSIIEFAGSQLTMASMDWVLKDSMGVPELDL